MRRPARQLPLELGHRTGLSRDELVVTDANRQAAALIDRWPDWEARVVVLAGPAGSGKSHLAAIWAERAGAVAAESAAIEALLGTAQLSGPVLVDDADAGGLDEPGLFHLINAVRGAGTGLLLTARRFPVSWGVALPDLASRLKAAPVVEILEPDDLLLAGVITKLFADRQVEVDPHVGAVSCPPHRALAVDRHRRGRAPRPRRAGEEDPHHAGAGAETIGAMDAGQAELDL